jgi:hypothetical protein
MSRVYEVLYHDVEPANEMLDQRHSNGRKKHQDPEEKEGKD